MANKTFLQLINDEYHRVYPLHYKHVKTMEIFHQQSFHNRKVAIKDFQSKKCSTFSFHKPISKMI
jgi:hypothetical protein